MHLTDVHREIIEYVRKNWTTREDIIKSVSGNGWPRGAVQKAFKELRKSGIIYQTPEGLYQTDWEGDGP